MVECSLYIHKWFSSNAMQSLYCLLHDSATFIQHMSYAYIDVSYADIYTSIMAVYLSIASWGCVISEAPSGLHESIYTITQSFINEFKK